MNLVLLERRFQYVKEQEQRVNYYYNPRGKNIPGMKKHVYINELKQDMKRDHKIYGIDPFQEGISLTEAYQNDQINVKMTKREPQIKQQQKQNIQNNEFNKWSTSQKFGFNTSHKVKNNAALMNIVAQKTNHPKISTTAYCGTRTNSRSLARRKKNIAYQAHREAFDEKYRDEEVSDLNYIRMNQTTKCSDTGGFKAFSLSQFKKWNNERKTGYIEQQIKEQDIEIQRYFTNEKIQPLKNDFLYKIKIPSQILSLFKIIPKFNAKLTDISGENNPFVLFDNLDLDSEGYLLFDAVFHSILNPLKHFPWLNTEKGHTLKIEVTTDNELILLRYINFGYFDTLKYPEIFLEISNNFYQNESILRDDLKDKAEIVLQAYEEDIQREDSLLQNSRVQEIIQHRFRPEQTHYYITKAIMNPYRQLLINMKQLNTQNIERNIYEENVKRLLSSNQEIITLSIFSEVKIIVEFKDAILHAHDLNTFSIMKDDETNLPSKIQTPRSYSPFGKRQEYLIRQFVRQDTNCDKQPVKLLASTRMNLASREGLHRSLIESRRHESTKRKQSLNQTMNYRNIEMKNIPYNIELENSTQDKRKQDEQTKQLQSENSQMNSFEDPQQSKESSIFGKPLYQNESKLQRFQQSISSSRTKIIQ